MKHLYIKQVQKDDKVFNPLVDEILYIGWGSGIPSNFEWYDFDIDSHYPWNNTTNTWLMEAQLPTAVYPTWNPSDPWNILALTNQTAIQLFIDTYIINEHNSSFWQWLVVGDIIYISNPNNTATLRVKPWTDLTRKFVFDNTFGSFGNDKFQANIPTANVPWGWEDLYKSKIYWLWSLPTPQITQLAWSDIQIIKEKSWHDVRLHKAPIVVVQDLSPSQIAQWVKLAFGYYRASKSRSNKFRGNWYKAWYVWPSHFVAWVCPNDWSNTRGGIHSDWLDKIAQYDITNHGQVIDFWQSLSNRVVFDDLTYRDNFWNNQLITVAIQPRRKKASRNYLSGKYHYSTRYAPLYFVARYEFKQPDWTRQSGPESKIFSMVHLHHPFIYDPIASATFWVACWQINPLFIIEDMVVFNSTSRLPA